MKMIFDRRRFIGGLGAFVLVPNARAMAWVHGAAAKLLPANPRIGFIGDSQFEHNTLLPTSAATLSQASVRGFFVMCQALNPNFRIDTWPDPATVNFINGLNQGVASDTTNGVLARIGDVITKNPDAIFVLCGFNNSTTAMDSATGLPAIYTQIRAAYAGVIVMTTIWPSPATTAQILTDNSDLRTYVSGKQVTDSKLFLWDAFQALQNGSNNAFANDQNDGIHESVRGALRGAFSANDVSLGMNANSLRAMLTTLMPAGTNICTDMWASGGGNGNTNPTFTGTGGSKGAGVTGSVADNWTLARGSAGYNSTAVASLEANLDTGGFSQIVDITSVGAGTLEVFNLTNTAALSAGTWGGQWVQGFMEIETDGAAFITAPSYAVRESGGAARSIAWVGDQSGNDWNLMFSNPYKLWALTQPNFLSATPGNGVTTISLGFQPDVGVGTTARFKIRRTCFKITADPR